MTGSVWAWGRNDEGQLGDGTGQVRHSPVQVLGLGGVGWLDGVAAVAAGGLHTLAVRVDGTVVAWGDNTRGQLGDGTDTQRNWPVPVKGVDGSGLLDNVIAVAAGSAHSVALRADGSVVAWGGNDQGQLGDAGNADRPVPHPVVNVGNFGSLLNIRAIDCGEETSFAVRSNGTVVAWGKNDGALGNEKPLVVLPVPTPVLAITPPPPGQPDVLTGVVAVSSYFRHTLAVRTDGTAVAWGYNEFGQLGNGQQQQPTVIRPVTVVAAANQKPLLNVVGVGAGGLHSYAVLTSGMLRAWGDNSSGEAGIGTKQPQVAALPGLVKNADNTSTFANAVFVGGSNNHGYALRADGTVHCWGENNQGVLGDGTTIARLLPTQVPTLNGVRAVRMRALHCVALV